MRLNRHEIGFNDEVTRGIVNDAKEVYGTKLNLQRPCGRNFCTGHNVKDGRGCRTNDFRAVFQCNSSD